MPRDAIEVLFDFAGTLFAPRAPEDWVRAAAADAGVRLGAGEFARLAGAYLAAGLPGATCPAAVPDAVAALYAERRRPGAHRAAYVALLSTVAAPAGPAQALYERVATPEHWVPYADTHEVVRALTARGIGVGVVSNVGFDLRPILRAHGLPALAERCTLSYEEGAVKPEPAIFAAAVGRLGVPPGATLMVGDHPEADGGAVAAGCRTLLLPMSPAGRRHGLDAVLDLVGAEPPVLSAAFSQAAR